MEILLLIWFLGFLFALGFFKPTTIQLIKENGKKNQYYIALFTMACLWFIILPGVNYLE